LWIVDIYALVFAGLLLFAGALGDRFGRKGALLTGLVVFAAASVFCSQSTEPSFLIVCRGVMGIGAALVMPATLSLLTSVFPPLERPRAIAAWAGFAGAGGAIGPIMGGALLDRFWYGSVFFVAVPIAAIAFVMIWLLAPTSKEQSKVALDPLGALLSVVGFSALLLAIIEGPEKGWGSALVIGGFVASLAGLAGFVVWERRRREPMLDMQLFRISRFTMSSIGVTCTFMAMFATFFVLTQYLQYVRGYSPLRAGLAGLPFAITMIIVSPRAATLVNRFGARRVVAAAPVLAGCGLLLLSFCGQSTPYVVVGIALSVFAAGQAAAMPAFTSGIMSSVPMHKAGVGSAVNDTTREVGGAIGIAVIGSVVASVYRHEIEPALAALPPEAAEQASRNVGRAVGVAEQLRATIGDRAGDEFLVAVRDAFVTGGHLGLRLAAAIAVAVGASFVFAYPDTPRADHGAPLE
jgi:EmrB/QacA subfamily drug resistance transporter